MGFLGVVFWLCACMSVYCSSLQARSLQLVDSNFCYKVGNTKKLSTVCR